MKKIQWGQMRVWIARSTEAMAMYAAEDFAGTVQSLLEVENELNIIFAGAESQQAFHAALVARDDIDWTKINAFAVDEFYSPGMPDNLAVLAQPNRDLYSKIPIRSIHTLSHSAPDAEQERARYETLLTGKAMHVACIGIGTSGHLALNEPKTTDFNDPHRVRVTDICETSKRQLEADPNFRDLPEIPGQGITMTIPMLLSARHLITVVPYRIKAEIIRRLRDTPEATTELPASILREKTTARLYLDDGSASLIPS